MKFYEILRTKNTEIYADDLIGMTFPCMMVDEADFYNLITCNGQLIFTKNELKEVKIDKSGLIYKILNGVALAYGIKSDEFMYNMKQWLNCK